VGQGSADSHVRSVSREAANFVELASDIEQKLGQSATCTARQKRE
jgi:hypothetical protein